MVDITDIEPFTGKLDDWLRFKIQFTAVTILKDLDYLLVESEKQTEEKEESVGKAKDYNHYDLSNKIPKERGNAKYGAYLLLSLKKELAAQVYFAVGFDGKKGMEYLDNRFGRGRAFYAHNDPIKEGVSQTK
jgi:hypothetical protein